MNDHNITLTVLGCGGSLGVPLADGQWGACDPHEPKNKRSRPSICLQSRTTSLLVDATPDLRQQLLTHSISKIDRVFFTHTHADHIHGIDDLRPFIWKGKSLPAHMDEATHVQLQARFAYAISSVQMERGFYMPILDPVLIDMQGGQAETRCGDMNLRCFEQKHGRMHSLGFRLGEFAYSTDMVDLSPSAREILRGVKIWLVDATRRTPHSSHAHLARTLELIQEVEAQSALLTHMNHTMDYQTLCQELPEHIRPAYDGLTLTFKAE